MGTSSYKNPRRGSRLAELVAHADAVHLCRALLSKALRYCAAQAADDVVLFSGYDLAGIVFNVLFSGYDLAGIVFKNTVFVLFTSCF